MGGYLEVHHSEGAERVELAGDLLTLGRSEDNSVAFPSDTAVSRDHAVLQRVSGGWVLRDVGSSNGTYVNGAMLEGERLLAPGDECLLGSTRVVFRGDSETVINAPAPSAPPSAAERVGPLDLREEWDATPAAAPAAAPAPAPGDRVAPTDTPAAPFAFRAPEPEPHPVQPPLEMARGRGRSHMRGVARDVQVRSREERQEVLQFRLERYDSDGNRLPPVAVVFAGYEGGQIGEGDEVEVSGRWSRGALKARRVTNLSTGAEVHGLLGWQKAVVIVVVGLILCFFLFIAISIITAEQPEPPF